MGDFGSNANGLVSKGAEDGMIVKLSENGEIQWIRGEGGNKSDRLNSVNLTLDGGYIVSGIFSSDIIQLGDLVLNNKGKEDGIIIKYNADGEIEWANSIGNQENDNLIGIIEDNNGEFIATGTFKETLQINNMAIESIGEEDIFIARYSKQGKIKEIKSIGSINSDTIHCIVSTSDGGYMICGNFYNTMKIEDTIVLNGHGRCGFILKLNSDDEVQMARKFDASSTSDADVK